LAAWRSFTRWPEMRTAIVAVVAFILLAALSWPVPSQAGISITGADQVRDLAAAASAGLSTAASDVTPRIDLDSPNAIRIVPLVDPPPALVAALRDVPFRIYLPTLER
jgi:hypothetical protein